MTEANDESTFEYRPLDEASREIRLIKILPGQPDDELILEMSYAPLVPEEPPPGTRVPIGVIDSNLSYPWRATETLDKRYIFQNLQSHTTTWSHPDPNVDRSTYDCPALLGPYHDFEPKYEGGFKAPALWLLSTLSITNTS